MYYAKTITVPAGTPETNKQRTTIRLHDGVIREIRVQGLRGVGGQVLLAIRRYITQLVPDGSDSIMVTPFPIVFPTFHAVRGPPRRLRIYTWSPDAQHDHTVFVGVYLQSWEAFELEFGRGFFR